jgi:hypothetical protein
VCCVVDQARADYAPGLLATEVLRRWKAAIPISPRAKSSAVEGSGTVAGDAGASPQN